MRIERLTLRNFRNHGETEIVAAPGLNLITGPNGSGKTNLIDAIHYLCMSRSFVMSGDQYVVKNGESYFMVEGDFRGSIRASFTVGCNYSRGQGKKMFVNDSPLEKLSDLIGRVPVVVMSPEDLKLTRDGPVERRSFLDSMISQVDQRYLRDLLEYRQVRRQRNKLLQDAGGRWSVIRDSLEVWDRQLAERGAAIIQTRAAMLERFAEYLATEYRTVSGLMLKPTLRYRTIAEEWGDAAELTEIFMRRLEEVRERELEREQTLVGPHRDEIVFYLDDMDIRKYGSQGQHRLFSMALKLAQLSVYTDELDDLPILLLDDLFGNLDQQKTETIVKALARHRGQTFITAASEQPYDEGLFRGDGGAGAGSGSSAHRWFTVSEGKVQLKFTEENHGI
ncbi:MAG: DNA replication and repair protein RecF [Bacteroidetes bacterium]|nr:MAG: DNA replication and repair protein RecF [Bacteroidota bacterium]